MGDGMNKMPNTKMSSPSGDIPSKEVGNSSFNVDELVRKIDAKIAALEQEEKENKEREAKEKESSNVEVIGDKDSELFHKAMEGTDPKKELAIEDEEEDDDFFDDFFDS